MSDVISTATELRRGLLHRQSHRKFHLLRLLRAVHTKYLPAEVGEDQPELLVLNKADRLGNEQREAMVAQHPFLRGGATVRHWAVAARWQEYALPKRP